MDRLGRPPFLLVPHARIKSEDAQKGTHVLDLTEEQAEELGRQGGRRLCEVAGRSRPPSQDCGDPLERLVVRKRVGKTEDRLEIVVHEILGDVSHEMGEAAGLEKDGVERDLQEELAAQPQALGEELRLVRREWPTDIGPVDLMCRDAEDGWVAVEIKRIGTIEAVEQLARYLERIRQDPSRAATRGILAAQRLKPQAGTLAEARGIRCVEVDLQVLRGEREPDLTLFA
jgi:RecB family endonuclease NucS